MFYNTKIRPFLFASSHFPHFSPPIAHFLTYIKEKMPF